MNDIISHRGPDGEGFLFSDNNQAFDSTLRSKSDALVLKNKSHTRQVALGHRRLSIIDLSDVASQPMADDTKTFWIVFNGEIYNHQELRNELEEKGCCFITDHSDTEVILNAYKTWGKDCLQRFNGMFSFCIWDTNKDEFFLARDRMGIKPLYYTEHKGALYFGSEVKTLLVNKGVSRKFNNKAIYDYLTFTAVPASNTIFDSISKLPAAHCFYIRQGKIEKPVRYWNPLAVEKYKEASDQEICELILSEIDKSAQKRMIADVEVGVLLSGGVDSSANLAMLSKHTDKPIKAFSIGFENQGNYKNEFKYSRKVAKQFGAEYHELLLTPEDFNSFFPKMVYYQDEPIADTANIPIYYLSKKAREEGVTVLLGGEGSDELLIGYKGWALAKQYFNLVEKNGKGMPNY
jgi:asparagine synthase (glutamine-hydrolysing)